MAGNQPHVILFCSEAETSQWNESYQVEFMPFFASTMFFLLVASTAWQDGS